MSLGGFCFVKMPISDSSPEAFVGNRNQVGFSSSLRVPQSFRLQTRLDALRALASSRVKGQIKGKIKGEVACGVWIKSNS